MPKQTVDKETSRQSAECFVYERNLATDLTDFFFIDWLNEVVVWKHVDITVMTQAEEK